MRPVIAIAVITIRSAIRSRIMLCLMALLIAIVTGLPATIKGDGTAAGYAQIVIGYTLGFSGALLAMATLWGGCAAISTEIEDKQIQMLLAKPVHRAHVWLGKWAGLMTMNVLLLGVAVGTTNLMLHRSANRAQLSPAENERLTREVLIARREARPSIPDVHEAAQERFEQMAKAGKMPSTVDPRDALDTITRTLRMEAGAVGSGQGKTWEIRLPQVPAEGDILSLRYKFSSASPANNPFKGVWIVGPPADPSSFRMAISNTPAAYGQISIPASALRNSSTMTLSYANVDDGGETVFFEADDCIAVLLPAGGFSGNLLRGALVVLAQLAFLAAIGVTAGAIFSLPVAAFLSMCALLLLLSAGFIEEMASQKAYFGRPDQATATEQAANFGLRVLYGTMAAMTKPLTVDSPWDDVATGRLVEWRRVARAGGFNFLLYGGLAALFGIYVFNRREVALPQT